MENCFYLCVMKKEVTIGIPVYHVKDYIRQTLDSVLAQTFPDIEFLVLDDCGTDGSMDIVREYQQSHPRGKDIRIVRQPRNMGLGAARNRMVEEAQGRYIYFVDADDTIAPRTIELLYGAARRHRAQLVYGSYERIDNFSGSIRREAHCYPAMQFLEEDAFARYVYRKYDGIQAMIWNILIDVGVYRDNQLRHQHVNYWEDFSFTMLLPTYVSRVVLLPDITYYYYCRYGSLSNFARRDHIPKHEIQLTIDAINQLKDKTDRLRSKPYFPRLMYKLMMTDFYIVENIFRNRRAISPSFSRREIRDIFRSPLSLKEVLGFSQARLPCLALLLLGKLHPLPATWLMRLLIAIR